MKRILQCEAEFCTNNAVFMDEDLSVFCHDCIVDAYGPCSIGCPGHRFLFITENGEANADTSEAD